MKSNKHILWILVAMVLVASLYRILPNRPLGFAPQIAMALFAGSIFRNRGYAIALPLLSMLLGDLVFQALHTAGLAPYGGFYKGQLTNYILFAGLTMLGFFIQHNKSWQVALGVLAGPTAYFFISNFLVWLSGGGYHHPKTFSGLLMTYTDGIPFYTGSLYATAVFATLFFGGYNLLLQSRKLTTAALLK